MMVFVWGHKERPVPDGVTVESDYTCPRCTYNGRLFLYSLKRKTTVYFIPVGPWHGGEGVMICPACGNDFVLGKRTYRKLDKITEGQPLEEALQVVDAEIERQFPLPDSD